jgi:APA family basic amino acid/polyamine antiporter
MPTTELRRTMGVVRASAMVAGIIIGASIFVQPSQVTGAVPSQAGVLAVWLTAGLLTLIGALVVAELASAWPRTGGVYVFLRDAYSPALGFLWGWAMFWTMHTGIIAAIAMVLARYVGTFVPLGPTGTRAVAIGAVALLSAINYVGVRPASAVQAALTFVKVVAILVIIGVAFLFGPASGGLQNPTPSSPTTFVAFVNALIAGLFAFGGWHMVSYSADETVDPTRTIPRALLIGTLTVTVLYVALNAAYLHVLPIDAVAASTHVAADLAEAVAPGRGSAEAVSLLVILSTLGAANGVILAGPRVYLAMANDGLAFRSLAAVHPQFRTPHRAILAQAAWASVLIATNTFRALFTRVVYTEWIFFALMAASLYLLRRRPDYAPRYHLRGYRVLAGVFVLSSAAIVLTQIVTDPRESATGLLLVLSGIPVYYLWIRKRRQNGEPISADR